MNIPHNDDDNAEETIEVIPDLQNQVLWHPEEGEEVSQLMATLNVSEDSKQSILEEAKGILSRCVPPTAQDNNETGLVIGYVQSGKTMSFTTVTALARDNGYQMIIVIAGTSKNLLAQSEARLRRDLRLDVRVDRKWQLFVNPDEQQSNVSVISDTLMDWQDEYVDDSQRQSILITVMKNHHHLRHLRDLLIQLDLSNVPTLIIDDEADQASLNTQVNEDDQSTTYSRLLELREQIPSHTFLQYTATPQAPLLINIIDTLSPNFARILEPGDNYVGGRDFFLERENQLIRLIPDNEILGREDDRIEPPPTLLDAMLLFYVGVAAGMIVDRGRGNRSMIIHPTHRTDGHQRYYDWVQNIERRWRQILDLNDFDPDKEEFLEQIQQVHERLFHTVENIPPLNEDFHQQIKRAIRRTRVIEVNSRSGATPEIDWRGNYSYILVGGQALDRGFTVEGLTVTYMPRSVGVGNIDTVQQRARFFGYKRHYLGYCRVYLGDETRRAYTSYVEHEEDVRNSLKDFAHEGNPLASWKRAFLMPRGLRPTRNSVIDVDYVRGGYADTWFDFKMPHYTLASAASNFELVNEFINQIDLRDDNDYLQSTSSFHHHRKNTNISLEFVQREFLSNFRVLHQADSERFTGLRLQIRHYLEENSDATCSIYLMGGENGPGTMRERGTRATGEIRQLFAGAFLRNRVAHPEIYPGDREIGDKTHLIVQIHILRVKVGDNRLENIPTLGIYVPESMEASWLSQIGQ
mgnify:CR=1 FL=1